MSRYHHLINTHREDHALVLAQIQRIMAALDAGDIETARAELSNVYENASKMRTMFEEMSMLVKVLMLEFQSDDLAWRVDERSRSKPRRPANVSQAGAIQLELFELLTALHAKRQRSG